MSERHEFRLFLISMLSAAVVGARLADAKVNATEPTLTADDLNCPGFHQFTRFNQAGVGFNEFESCTFNEVNVDPLPIPEVPLPTFPDLPPGDPGSPGDPLPI